MLKSGSAEINITPPVGVELVGQWVARKSTGINDELFANAMVLDDGKNIVALLSCDVLSIVNSVKQKIRSKITKDTNINPENIFICATHTHTAPAVASALGTNMDKEYTEKFVELSAQCVIKAYSKMENVNIGIGSGNVHGLSFPRRFWMKDGTIKMHPPKADPNIVRPDGVADPEVNVLYTENENGKVNTVFINFACHPTVVGGDNVISADYPGAVRDTIKNLLGQDTVVLYGNGACGNIGPVDMTNPKRNEYGHKWRKKMGLVLGCETIKTIALSDLLPPEELELEVRKDTLDIPIREIPQDRLDEAKKAFIGKSLEMAPADRSDIVRRELLLLAEQKAEDPFAHAEIMAIRIGRSAIIGIPAELFCDLGLKIKEKSNYKPTFVVELANGCIGYVPTAESFIGGGYETELVRSSKLIPEAGEMIVQKAVEILNRE
ncbi:MAG: neutral/alkaline non-lysosomal ceramidase N-terminal domain-containing protein [bacterium]